MQMDLKKIVPRDPNNPEFVQWFHPHQEEEYEQFFKEFGFVAVKVLNDEECTEMVNEVWNYAQSCSDKINRNDPKSWNNRNWPAMKEEGILGSPPVWTANALAIRQHPLLYGVFAKLIGKKELYVNHDRYGLFRPTKNVEIIEQDGTVTNENFPANKSFWNIHLDVNPWSFINNIPTYDVNSLTYQRRNDFIEENNHLNAADGYVNLQGLVNFIDNRTQDGGFHLIPGFHHHFEEWARATENTLGKAYMSRSTFIVLPEHDYLKEAVIRVAVPAGCCIVWDQRTIHGSAPNDSERPRLCQFFKYYPALDVNLQRTQHRRRVVAENVAKAKFEPSELGKKLFGLVPW